MNKMPLPAHDDHGAIALLANNPRVESSYPHLQASVVQLQQGYAQYVAAEGNAFAVQSVPISAQVGEMLKGHYESPVLDISYIGKMRDDAEFKSCPMCGSSQNGTLDHFFSQNGYPEFAIFSSNLVPACKCNSRRQEILKGLAPNERLLHPYFDECLSERLIIARIEDLGETPSIQVMLAVPTTHPNFQAIEFHFEKIVKKTGILRFLGTRWGLLCENPKLVIRGLKVKPDTLESLKTELLDELQMLDDANEGKNNWHSVFLTGLLAPPVLRWLFAKLTAAGRENDGPLIV